ncbi:MAG TPA: hypothetical protein VE378_00050 [Nitrososphaeraceae archaeon]|nr:hypothetical protein [Nitrososphaeraceae archaeon]
MLGNIIWFVKGYAFDTRQESLWALAAMQLVRRDVKFARYLLSGKGSGAHAAGIDYDQNQGI